ncbi:MAG: heat-inducible transcriptional repressor HrcA [Clostridia bacterium]|nr:heat-inducible transcriptional repressor HrcA [Clostridia bacterium]
MRIDERKQKVLLAIIQDYIATAEPVGSRTISRKTDLGVSPATIRNEMSDLEEMGYIEQPHTSSGRVPSDLGYRYYVDFMMEKQKLSNQEQDFIRHGYESKKTEISAVIQQTSKILSQLTNYTSIVLSPQGGRSAFKHLQLVPLEPGKALVVVVTESGFIHNKIIDIPEKLKQEELIKISQVLNAKLQGHPLEEIKRTLISEIYFELNKHKEIFNIVMELLQNDSPGLAPEDKVCLAGTLNMLNQPEFRQIEKVKTLLSLLDQDDLLRNLMTVNSQEEGVNISIGEENKQEGLRDCSMITATYHIDGQLVGSIGVLGPTRMEYAKVVSIVEYMTQNLEEILRNCYGGKRLK